MTIKLRSSTSTVERLAYSIKTPFVDFTA